MHQQSGRGSLAFPAPFAVAAQTAGGQARRRKTTPAGKK